MAYQTWIADQCRSFGLQVEEYPGWHTRGSERITPECAVAHWTAGPCGTTGRPSLGVVVNGRSDVPGPLCNVYLDRNGICVIVAAGVSNNAGFGGFRNISGNSKTLGVEAECCNAGDWTSAQLAVWGRLLAALVTGAGRDQTWVCRHNDWTSRKIDTYDLELSWLQQQTEIAIANHGSPGPTPIGKAAAKMFLWTTDQNDGQQVNYLWDGEKVVSLFGLNGVAWNLSISGLVPHSGHVNENDHNILLNRLINRADPSGTVGVWDGITNVAVQ